MVPARVSGTGLLRQTVVNGADYAHDLSFRLLHEKTLSSDDLSIFSDSFVLGVSPAYAKSSGLLICLAIANNDHIRVVELINKNKRANSKPSAGQGSQVLKSFLVRGQGKFFAFDVGSLAAALLYVLSLPPTPLTKFLIKQRHRLSHIRCRGYWLRL